jgi:hypothetical protein
LRTAELTGAARTKAVESSKLTSEDCRKLQGLLTAADEIGHALAADDVAQFNQGVLTFTNRLADLEQEMSAGEPWTGIRQSLAGMSRLQPVQDLAEARQQFLPFSTATVELVKQMKKQDRAFADLKVYHCPMAPKPGLWIQATGPLANPFYGKQMLRCGEEMKP